MSVPHRVTMSSAGLRAEYATLSVKMPSASLGAASGHGCVRRPSRPEAPVPVSTAGRGPRQAPQRSTGPAWREEDRSEGSSPGRPESSARFFPGRMVPRGDHRRRRRPALGQARRPTAAVRRRRPLRTGSCRGGARRRDARLRRSPSRCPGGRWDRRRDASRRCGYSRRSPRASHRRDCRRPPHPGSWEQWATSLQCAWSRELGRRGAGPGGVQPRRSRRSASSSATRASAARRAACSSY